MKTSTLTGLALLLLSFTPASASTVYQNTTTDTLNTYLYSVGPFTQIGDTISLAGTDRTLTDATVQFFNNGSSGTFDATLRFFNAGSPVGSQIGSSFVLTGISMNSFAILNVTFSGLNLLVPSNLVFTVSVSNVTGGADVGLNVFDPPTVGSSDSTTFVTHDGTSFSAQNAAPGQGNPYLQLNATTAVGVPEPATFTMAGGALLLAGLLRARKRS